MRKFGENPQVRTTPSQAFKELNEGVTTRVRRPERSVKLQENAPPRTGEDIV